MPASLSFRTSLSSLLLLSLLRTSTLALPVAAATATEATVEGYQRAALAADPDLAVAAAQAEEARWMSAAAGRRPDPALSVEFENVHSRQGPAMIVTRISQALPWPGTLRAQAEAAASAAQAATAERVSRALAVAESAGSLALELAYLDRAAALARESAATLDSLRPVLTERVRQGGDAAELLRLEVEIGLAYDAALAYEREADRVSAALASRLGRPVAERMPAPPLPEDLPAARDFVALTSRLSTAHPTVLAALANATGAQQQAEAVRRENRPMLGFGISHTESRMEPAHGARRPEPWSLEVMVSVPLQRDRRKALESAAIARARRAEAEVEARRRALTGLAATAAADLREATDRARRHDQELLPAARSALDLAVTRLAAGLGSITDVVERHRVVLELETTLVQSRARAHQADLRLAALAGGLPTAP